MFVISYDSVYDKYDVCIKRTTIYAVIVNINGYCLLINTCGYFRLTVLYENGVIQNMLKTFKPKAKLETNDESGNTQFVLTDLKAAVVVCAVSVGISCIILAVECFLKKI